MSATVYLRGHWDMLKYYVKGFALLERLREDKDGVVSFEYVIVAACIVAAVAAAFGTGTASGIGAALKTGIGDVTTAFTTAITG
jgi:pilus assembly protein Flp/PilA